MTTDENYDVFLASPSGNKQARTSRDKSVRSESLGIRRVTFPIQTKGLDKISSILALGKVFYWEG